MRERDVNIIKYKQITQVKSAIKYNNARNNDVDTEGASKSGC